MCCTIQRFHPKLNKLFLLLQPRFFQVEMRKGFKLKREKKAVPQMLFERHYISIINFHSRIKYYGGARLCAIRNDSRPSISSKNRSTSELTQILNDECKFDEYVHLHCLQILYE